MNKICIISGPTASGKTATSINLAKEFGGEIVNFDSLLFYKELNIGTAKPTKEEQKGINHYMIDSHTAKEPINAAQYSKEALPIIQKLHQNNKIVYLVGGSGFYLQALLYGMFDSKTTPKDILKRSDILYHEEGITPFREILKEKDPESFEHYHLNDHYRIRRAVEHFWATQRPFSQSRKEMKDKREHGPMKKFAWDVFHIYLDIPKEEHLKIIEQRTKKMINNGLMSEVENLLASGFTGEEKPLKSIGYKECFDFIHGKLTNEEQLMERINISTRQLAKSQRTWFKKIDKRLYNPILEQNIIRNDFKSFLQK